MMALSALAIGYKFAKRWFPGIQLSKDRFSSVPVWVNLFDDVPLELRTIVSLSYALECIWTLMRIPNERSGSDFLVCTLQTFQDMLDKLENMVLLLKLEWKCHG